MKSVAVGVAAFGPRVEPRLQPVFHHVARPDSSAVGRFVHVGLVRQVVHVLPPNVWLEHRREEILRQVGLGLDKMGENNPK